MATMASARHRAAAIFRTYRDILRDHAEGLARAGWKVLTFLGHHPRKSKLLANWHP
jgi:hypothetical protein